MEDYINTVGKGLYVIKFLNTQLAGCEYLITESETLFIVGKYDDIKEMRERLVSPGCIFVPDDNLSLTFGICEKQGRLYVNDSHDSVEEEKVVSFQKVYEISGVFVALRTNEDKEWSEEIRSFSLSETEYTILKKTKWLVIISTMLLISFVVAGFIQWYQNGQLERKKHTLAEILGREFHTYLVNKGNDRVWYIFAKQNVDKQWAIRSIQKVDLNDEIKVIGIEEEKIRIANELRTRLPEVHFHLMRFDNPEHPELVLSSERSGVVTERDSDNLRNTLLKLIPYAKDVAILSLSDSFVAKQAEEGLRKVDAAYTRKDGENSVVFVVRGTLQDNELNALKNFTNAFKEQWNGQYINFEIELEKNWLKNKSFHYGNEGYIKMTPGHWYFPLNKES